MRKYSAAILREIREIKHMSREDLARAGGTTSTTIRNYERGLANPSVNRLAALAEVLGVTESTFFVSVGGDGNE